MKSWHTIRLSAEADDNMLWFCRNTTHSYNDCLIITTHWYIYVDNLLPNHIIHKRKNTPIPAARLYIHLYRKWPPRVRNSKGRQRTEFIYHPLTSNCIHLGYGKYISSVLSNAHWCEKRMSTDKSIKNVGEIVSIDSIKWIFTLKK